MLLGDEGVAEELLLAQRTRPGAEGGLGDGVGDGIGVAVDLELVDTRLAHRFVDGDADPAGTNGLEAYDTAFVQGYFDGGGGGPGGVVGVIGIGSSRRGYERGRRDRVGARVVVAECDLVDPPLGAEIDLGPARGSVGDPAPVIAPAAVVEMGHPM